MRRFNYLPWTGSQFRGLFAGRRSTWKTHGPSQFRNHDTPARHARKWNPCLLYTSILLSMAQGEVIDESYRNNDKYEKRAKRTIDVYGYEDDISEQFHRELITPFVDPFEQAEEERIEEEKEQLRQLEIAKVRKVLEMLKPVQRERLIKAILLGMSSRKIAKEEGVYYSVVDKSIAAARKNFKKFYENL